MPRLFLEVLVCFGEEENSLILFLQLLDEPRFFGSQPFNVFFLFGAVIRGIKLELQVCDN